MKSRKIIFLRVILLMLLLPAVLRPFFREGQREIARATEPQGQANSILVRQAQSQVQMDLEEYVVGVVLAEMPAEFETEALKAQAVVARTFAWKAAVTGGKHGDGSVCIDPSCCQGYVAPGHFLQSFGTDGELEKVRAAVSGSAGLVLTYQGELIEATYFSSTAGYTEDAAAVWGSSYPYLVSTESPEKGDEESVAFSRAYLEKTLAVQLGEDTDSWFTQWEYTSGVGVASVTVGGKSFPGTLLRRKLNLRSTVFTVTIQNDAVVFHTQGYGHRVGMSQLGADAMAAVGSTFEEILTYYYTGAELERLDRP